MQLESVEEELWQTKEQLTSFEKEYEVHYWDLKKII
jgi:hypothetical protein